MGEAILGGILGIILGKVIAYYFEENSKANQELERLYKSLNKEWRESQELNTKLLMENESLKVKIMELRCK